MDLAIVFFPLFGAFIAGFFGKYLGSRFTEIISTLFIFLAAFLSLIIFYKVIFFEFSSHKEIFTWIESGSLKINWSIKIDALTSVMLVVVTLISTLVHLYSIGYMSHDPHRPRFMSYLSLFTFCMIVLITADNFLQLFFGWEGVGLCSYLLIGFWYKKNSANVAAIKAFIVNRVGDFGLALGIFLIFFIFGSVNYDEVFNQVSLYENKVINLFGINFNLITIICILLFIGAMGKSAQFLLHTWLPDAMEGPTPVSALIHAATMVTAGVFLIVRCSPLFEFSPMSLNVIAVIGMITAFFAATTALAQNDIKKIIAYSTCSQLGYMFFAVGIGAYHLAIFHLFTHAFFKALLFLGAGSVIHSFNDEQNINLMGGVWKKIPFTWVFMLIGTLSLTGFPFLSGYFSKDAIIEFAFSKNSTIGNFVCFVAIFTAFLTSLYSWRLFFKTFHGEYKNKKIKFQEIHESSKTMLVSIALLSIGAVFSGYLFFETFIGENHNQFWNESIFFIKSIYIEHPPLWFLITTPLLVIFSIPLSYYFFIKNNNILNQLTSKSEPEGKFLYDLFLNKWYIDEIYNFLFISNIKKIGTFFWKSIDINIIDRFGPNGLSKVIKFFSIKAGEFQSGYIYQYAFIMLIGLSVLLTYLILT
ncbi:MAG: NADH-quinone oxidoreductase subunit L [Candidatus Pelagibacter sp. TMED64]|nr:NADH-quinone oxidoreductase subunit L [Candidatus Pelagibacter sp.]OUU67553.1 MAG: NADH-quinone oxidoreductase subunit L [Candidatus Pelagibacter sp. TMED64]